MRVHDLGIRHSSLRVKLLKFIKTVWKDLPETASQVAHLAVVLPLKQIIKKTMVTEMKIVSRHISAVIYPGVV